ncbi:MAG TPA: hypothetical protein PK347_13055 [Burkholderiaceae bacterium]|nr:hypothetical protein [Burkholderiaceae bacterium]
MNPHISSFVARLSLAVLPTLWLVATTAFFSLPWSLGHHPGDDPAPSVIAPRHLT